MKPLDKAESVLSLMLSNSIKILRENFQTSALIQNVLVSFMYLL